MPLRKQITPIRTPRHGIAVFAAVLVPCRRTPGPALRSSFDPVVVNGPQPRGANVLPPPAVSRADVEALYECQLREDGVARSDLSQI
jgi:hypothetical protein